jgi:hypothetical protein
MSAREVPVKKYVVRLSAEERAQLLAMIRKGKSSAQRLMKARILLKADVSEGGEGWSDSQIVETLETSATTVYRTRQQLVEEGFEAVLSRKKPSRPSVLPIFDGEKEARLIALACSEPPQGRAQGNRVKKLCSEETCEKVVIPSGDFAAEPERIFARGSSDQIEGHVLDGGEVGRGVIGADAAFIVAEHHVHDPMKPVLDHPVAANGRSNLTGDPQQ